MDQGELAEQLALVSCFFGNLCKAILFFLEIILFQKVPDVVIVIIQ